VFYTFDQNNSGGGYDNDRTRGIGPIVVIEAASNNEANRQAEEIGLYFDGVDRGDDCECCGDRWYRVSEWNAGEVPTRYGSALLADRSEVPAETASIFVHYADGRVIGYGW